MILYILYVKGEGEPCSWHGCYYEMVPREPALLVLGESSRAARNEHEQEEVSSRESRGACCSESAAGRGTRGPRMISNNNNSDYVCMRPAYHALHALHHPACMYVCLPLLVLRIPSSFRVVRTYLADSFGASTIMMALRDRLCGPIRTTTIPSGFFPRPTVA